MDKPSIIPFKTFVKDVKQLKKRYKNILDDIGELKSILKETPTHGVSLGYGVYKLRIKNRDKNQGKRSGYRVITYYIDKDNTVYLVKIYDKSEIESIKTQKLLEIIKEELG